LGISRLSILFINSTTGNISFMKSKISESLSTAFGTMFLGWVITHLYLAFIFRFDYVMLAAGLQLFVFGLWGSVSLSREESKDDTDTP
jgi:hypothetical protein